MAGQQWQQGDNASSDSSDDIFMLVFWPMRISHRIFVRSPFLPHTPLPKNSKRITIFVKRKNFAPKKNNNIAWGFPCKTLLCWVDGFWVKGGLKTVGKGMGGA